MGVLVPVLHVPEDTFHAARRIYSIQHGYLRIGDQLSKILAAIDLGLLDPSAGLDSDTVLRLALTTAFQYIEGLPDQAASEATLRRIDWKYALFLPINHPGISPAALCAFRQRLYSSQQGLREFGLFFDKLVKIGLPAGLPATAGGTEQSWCAEQILSLVCDISRLYRLKLAMKMALGVLSSTRPDWLRTVVRPYWYERYKTGQLYLSIDSGLGAPLAEASAIGADIRGLLSALQQPDAADLANLPEVRSLAKVWDEQYQTGPGDFSWRVSGCANCRLWPGEKLR